MSSDTTSNLVRYVVYVLYGSDADVYPFRVPKDASVDDLKNSIRANVDLKPHLEKEPLSLFKCGELSEDEENLHNKAVNWLRQHLSDRLGPNKRLGIPFPEGKIDIIAMTDSFFDIHCTVYVLCESRVDVYLFSLKKDARVQDLEKSIRGNQNLRPHLEKESLSLFKFGALSMDQENLYDEVLKWLREGRNPLVPANPLKQHFSLGPKSGDDNTIDVIAVTESIMESFDELAPLPDPHRDRLSQVDRMRDFPSPSEGIKNVEKLSQWNHVGKDGVHAHRPSGNYGPPTALFHPALARLKDRLMHLDRLEEPSAEHFRLSHEFLQVCSDWVKDESALKSDLKRIIQELVNAVATWEMSIASGRAKADAAFDFRTNAVQLVMAFLEVKVMDGMGGNASLQAALDFTKLLSQPEYKRYMDRSNFPIILVGLMGTRLEISTAIYTDGVYVDKLFSEEFSIDAWQSETVLRVGRIFKALGLAIAELREYYETLTNDCSPQPTTRHLYPDPLPSNDIQIPQLEYIGKLSHAGRLVAEENRSVQLLERPYGLYRAKMVADKSVVDVVVKFTVRYDKEAHQLLAAKGLAPTLYFYIRLVGGMDMIIMEYVEGDSLFRAKPQNHKKVYKDVLQAVNLLHEQDLVFGDLRRQNILCKRDGSGAMLIDFDWVGKHNVDRYPASWNNDEDHNGQKKWAPEVDRRVLMDKAHDTFMLAELKEALK